MSISVKIEDAYYKNKSVLSDVHFNCENGKITAIIGRNGSGKSTLVSAIAQQVKYEGEIFASDILMSSLKEKERARLLSVIFQKIKAPHITVKDLVSLGRSPYLSLMGRMSKNDLDIIEKAILDSDLRVIEDKYLDEISGGELKRAYFGMMLAQSTENIVLDEATAFMDRDYEKRLLDLIKKTVKKLNKCCVLVMHNLENAIKYADNILLLENGKQVFFGTTERILNTDLIEKSFSLKRITTNEITVFV